MYSLNDIFLVAKGKNQLPDRTITGLVFSNNLPVQCCMSFKGGITLNAPMLPDELRRYKRTTIMILFILRSENWLRASVGTNKQWAQWLGVTPDTIRITISRLEGDGKIWRWLNLVADNGKKVPRIVVAKEFYRPNYEMLLSFQGGVEQ